MTIFRNYFKILKAHKLVLLIYSGIFIVLAILSSRMNSTDNKYTKAKARMYLIDRSKTTISEGLSNHLEKNNEVLDMDEDIVDDKLFYKLISLAVELPEDFETNRQVNIKQAPNDIYSEYVKQDIEKYLRFVESYEKAGYSTEQAIKKTDKDLDESVKVSLKKASDNVGNMGIVSYFNFLSYVLMSQIILAVANISLAYNKETIYKRNLSSPVNIRRQNLELILGHAVTGIIIWLSYIILFAFLWKDQLFSRQILLMILNSLIFTGTTVCLAAFVSNMVNDENSLNGIVNVVTLGSCFLSGVFVPQSLLGDTASMIGKIFPVYYYVSNNNQLNVDPSFSAIRTNLIIMLAYALAFIVLSMMKKNKTFE